MTTPPVQNYSYTPIDEEFCAAADPQGKPSDKDDFQLVSRLDFQPGNTMDMTSMMEHWRRSWRVNSAYSFQLTPDPVAASSEKPNFVGRFEVRAGDYAGSFDQKLNADGILTSRSELRERFEARLGETYWYRFHTFIPENFPIEDNRLVIAQWHASDTGREASSLPLAVYYRSGALLIRARSSDKNTQLKDDDTTKVKLYTQNDFPRGEWHDFLFQVKWSYKSDGFVKAWMDGQQIADYRGAVGYKDHAGPYFKFGAYRDEEYMSTDAAGSPIKINATDPYVIYHDDYRRGRSCQDVRD